MVLSDTVGSLFAEVAPLLSGAGVHAAEDGQRWRVAMPDGQDIFAKLDESREALVLSSALGRPPEGREGALAIYLMKINFAWLESGGLRLAIDGVPDSGEVHLLWELPLGGLGAHEMHAALGNFSQKAVALRKLVTDGGPETPQGGPDQPDPKPDPHMIRV